MNKDDLKDEFEKACEGLAEEGLQQVLSQLTDEQVRDIGRTVVRQWVRGNILREMSKIGDSVRGIVVGDSQARIAADLLKDANIEHLELHLNMGAVIEAAWKVKEAEEAKADTEDEEVPTEACQPMFSAEDATEGSAEAESVDTETEGGAE